jgi:uncharacterized protein (UPF0297 family)
MKNKFEEMLFMSDTMISVYAAITTIGLTAVGMVVLYVLIGKPLQRLVDRIFG